jgi:hypothetical protein
MIKYTKNVAARGTAFYIILLSLLFCLQRCNNETETEVNIGQGYYYIPFQEGTFDVTMFSGNGVYVYKDSFAVPLIYPHIDKYTYDSSYVFIKQHFNFKETNYLLQSMIFHPIYFHYYNDLVPLDEKYVANAPIFNNSSLEETYIDSIMQEDSQIKKMMAHKENYYIIDKMRHKVTGPFTKKEFNEKAKSLGLSRVW